MKRILLTASLMLLATSVVGQPLGTGFSYQGELTHNGQPANGDFDFLVKLHPLDTGGVPLATVALSDVAVDDGVFTLDLDFGDHYDGTPRWLEISVGESAGSGGFETLVPRQPVLPAPYAQFGLDGAVSDPWMVATPIAFYPGRAGIGTATPAAQLEINSSASEDPLRVYMGDVLELKVDANRGVAIGSALTPPAQGLQVNGSVAVGASDPGTPGPSKLYVRNQGTEYGALVEDLGTSGGGNTIESDTAHASATAAQGYVTGTGSGIGVVGKTDADMGVGIFGYASATNGNATGVYAQSNSAFFQSSYALWARNESAPDAVAAMFEGNVEVDTNNAGKLFGIEIDGQTRLRLHANGGTSIGSDSVTPRSDGLHIAGPVQVAESASDAFVTVRGLAGDALIVRDNAGNDKFRLSADSGGATVGGDTDPPNKGLHVKGPVATGALTRWKTVNFASVPAVELDRAAEIKGSRLRCYQSEDCLHTLRLALPHDAIVTSLDARMFDNFETYTAITELRRRSVSGNVQIMAKVETGVSETYTEIQEFVDTSIDHAVIDASNYVYFLQVRLDGTMAVSTHEVSFISARVTYTTQSVLP
ncbi:MAG: hypothetical protein DHS20C11_18510 [Lysobacteraceae bacterium]|nr:MAG: hypothetical protein DHS20C11_18510 [Xanthomonadaceae bacterium]